MKGIQGGNSDRAEKGIVHETTPAPLKTSSGEKNSVVGTTRYQEVAPDKYPNT